VKQNEAKSSDFFFAKKLYFSFCFEKLDAKKVKNWGSFLPLNSRIGSKTDPILLLSEKLFEAKLAHPSAVQKKGH
jgi:hypothetical protein